MSKFNFIRVAVGGLLVMGSFSTQAETVVAEEVQEQEVVVIQETPAPVVVSQPAVVTQPTTVVEGAPLIRSKAEDLRNARQNAEIQTEQKIVEKLEESRLRDEQKRMQNLFGDKLNGESQAVEAPKAEAQPQVIVIQTEKAEEKKEEKEETVDAEKLKSEISESVKADLKKIADEEKASQEVDGRYYISGNIGFFTYDALNVDSDFAGGVAMGFQVQKRMDLEFGFMYSEHLVNESFYSYQKFDQYNLSAGLRYAALPYFITPVVGASISYTRREFYVPFGGAASDASVNSFDMGFLIGVDAELSKSMLLSVDYRRYINLQNSYGSNDLLAQSTFPRVEESDYDMVSVALRFLF